MSDNNKVKYLTKINQQSGKRRRIWSNKRWHIKLNWWSNVKSLKLKNEMLDQTTVFAPTLYSQMHFYS